MEHTHRYHVISLCSQAFTALAEGQQPKAKTAWLYCVSYQIRVFCAARSEATSPPLPKGDLGGMSIFCIFRDNVFSGISSIRRIRQNRNSTCSSLLESKVLFYFIAIGDAYPCNANYITTPSSYPSPSFRSPYRGCRRRQW